MPLHDGVYDSHTAGGTVGRGDEYPLGNANQRLGA